MTIAYIFKRRLRELADAADSIAAGNPAHFIATAGDDDIARLGRAFNNIVARMQSHLKHVLESRDRLIKPTEAMSEGFALWDRNDRLLLHNKQFRQIFSTIECSIRPGISFSLFARLVGDCLIEHEDAASRERWLEETNAQHRKPKGTRDLRLNNGRWASVYEFETPDGEIISIYRDVTERMTHETDRSNLQAILDSTKAGILTINAEGRVESCNVAAAEMFGYRDDEMHGRMLDELVPKVAAVDPAGILSVRGLAAMPNEHVVEVVGRRQDGTAFPIELSVTESDRQDNHAFIATIRDVTINKANEAKIHYQATHDSLTDLPNRSEFDTTLMNCLEIAPRTGERFAVLFLDLDRFKMVNDTLGHTVGDALLIELSKRLRSSLRESEIVARVGGDEFNLVLRNLSGRDHATMKASRILAAIQPPFALEGHELHVTASIGISMFPDDGKTSEHLLKMADLALYRAKDEGRNRVQLCTPSMNESVRPSRDLPMA